MGIHEKKTIGDKRVDESRNNLPSNRRGYELKYMYTQPNANSLEITSPPIGGDTVDGLVVKTTELSLEITSPPIGGDTFQNHIRNHVMDVVSRNNLPSNRRGYALLLLIASYGFSLEITSPPIGGDT